MPQNNLCFFSLIVVFKPTRVAHRLARRYVLGQPLKKKNKNKKSDSEQLLNINSGLKCTDFHLQRI